MSVERLIKEFEKKNLSDEEAKRIIKNLKGINPVKYAPKKINFPKKGFKFLAFGDSHIGHRNYRPDIMDKMVRDAKRNGCEFAINCGDTIEGMSNREGHIYELSELGYSAQLDRFEEEFSKFDKVSKDFPVYSIEAQNSHSGWAKNKGNAGWDIGEELQRRNNHYQFIGFDEQDIEVGKIKIRLRHPGGGTAYAICFDDKTEILTENGWKLFKDLKDTEKVATLNLKKDEFEWQLPNEYTKEDYEGEMIHFKARNIDLMVTPNHRMLVRRYPNNIIHGRKKRLLFPQKSHKKVNLDWTIKKAKELTDVKRQEWQMKRNVNNWEGELIEKVFIPERKTKKFGTRQSKRIEFINIEDIAELIGWYVTEGYIRKSAISICQDKKANPINHAEIIDLLNRIGFNPKTGGKNKKDIKFYSLEFAEWLVTQCGSGSKNKFIPKWLKNQPKDILRILFDTMIKGDGWINGEGYGYTSISKQLLDDMSEISLKLGYAVTTCKNSISITKKQVLPTINQKPDKVYYKGKIYCVSVPNTLIMVRRNGKAIWSGNSYKMQKYVESISGGTKPHMVFQGHFHKANYLFYRNIHCYDVGALQEQSPFMKKKNTPSHIGYWIVEAKVNNRGLERVINQFVPFFE